MDILEMYAGQKITYDIGITFEKIQIHGTI